MLYDLGFLEYGKPWPPEGEAERIGAYRTNRQLFNGDHAKIYREQFKRIERIVGSFASIISYPVLLNYHRLVSLKTADLIFSEPPKITAPTDELQEKLDEIIKSTDIFNVAYSSAIDASRYGDAVLTKSVQNGKTMITASSPDYWFPVVDRANINTRLYDVQGWAYPIDVADNRYRLRVVIYSPDSAEEIEYDLINSASTGGSETGAFKIGHEVTGSRKTLAGADANGLLVTAHNLLTTDAIYGTSDYEAFDSVLSEIMVRVSQISKVLDAHSSPTMTGPDLALEYDKDGYASFRAGDYIPRMKNEEPKPEYITWDASLAANFEQIKLLMHHLYTLSEMGSVLLGDFSESTGQVPSGTALRRLMMSPLAKAARVRNSYDRALKKLLAACMRDAGASVETEDISIIWNDGLPDDPAEEAQIMATRTGGKATLSQWSAIQRLDGMSDDDTQAEIDMIRRDDDTGAMLSVAGDGDEDVTDDDES